MKLRNLFIMALLLVASMTQAQMQMPTIPVDKDVRIGKLENGLTYYIRYNNWPEHRANFYIAQKVGSIQEEESQRGLAHFLEHMCFNGSDNFKGNNLIRYCESIGVQFGQDLNAYTSIDQTVYNIDNVPTTRQSSLDSCLLILHDWADGLTLDPTEIDKERGVIHEEWRLRTKANSRMLERNLTKLYPGSKYGERYPIGLMSVIDNFKPKELRDYYEKWYHPANQGIIVVGDVDVDHTEAMIKKLFGPIKNPKNAAPIVEEQVPDNATPIVVIDKDKEQTINMVQLMFKHDVFPDSLKNTMASLIYGYLRGAVTGMLGNRYTEASQKADCPYVVAMASDGDYLFSKTKGAMTIVTIPKDMAKTNDAVKAAMIEARRASEFGFTATEYERYKTSMMSALDKMYSNKDKRPNSTFYEECKSHFLNNAAMPSIDYYYETMKSIIPRLPVNVVNEVMKDLIPANDSNLVILNFNNEKEGNVYPTEAGLLGALNAARTEKIEAFVDNVKNEPLIKELPKPGKITKEVKNDKFGYSELTLSNGVTVVLKKTDFKKDQVAMSGEGKGGGSLYGAKDYANINMFDDVIEASGLGNFSNTELSKALAGKIASASLSMSGKYMTLGGSSTPKDVETMMQLTYLYFTKINKDQQSYDNVMRVNEVSLKNRSLSPETACGDSLTATMYGHNPRTAPMTLERLKDVNYDRILEIAKERTANANGWTFTIIGNYDEATIRQYICQYLAALPSTGKPTEGHRTLFPQKGIVDNIFYRKMETPKAMGYVVWTNEEMPYTLETAIQSSIAGEILSMVYLKKIREDESAAYTAQAQGSASMDGKDHSVTIFGACPMKPEKKDIALKIMYDEVKAMTTTIDESMLAKVKEIMLKNYDTSLKTNGYWMGVIEAFRKNNIDKHSDYKKIVSAQTTATIQAFMKEFLKPNNRITVMMLPKE